MHLLFSFMRFISYFMVVTARYDLAATPPPHNIFKDSYDDRGHRKDYKEMRKSMLLDYSSFLII